MEKKIVSKPRLPTSFWTVYVDLCLRRWLAEQAKKSEGGGDHGPTTIAPRPSMEGRRVDTA